MNQSPRPFEPLRCFQESSYGFAFWVFKVLCLFFNALFHFERHNWQVGCEQGLDILSLICGNISDSKSMEDLHKDVRKRQKHGSNEKLSSCLIQSIIMPSHQEEEMASPCCGDQRDVRGTLEQN